jgi:hypothetical protein
MYRVGDKVKWSSAAGILEGVIKEIILQQNGNREYVPFMLIYYGSYSCAMICATDAYIKMMKMELV